MELFFKLNLAVTVPVGTREFPDQPGIGICDGFLTVVDIDVLLAPLWNGLAVCTNGQFIADVACLGWINTTESPRPSPPVTGCWATARYTRFLYNTGFLCRILHHSFAGTSAATFSQVRAGPISGDSQRDIVCISDRLCIALFPHSSGVH